MFFLNYVEPQILWFAQNLKFSESSSPGEFHPQALTESDVNLSIHPAPVSHFLETSQFQADAERN